MKVPKLKPTETVPEPKVPSDLREAIAAAPPSKAAWNDLTPIARRDFIAWIDDAERENRKRPSREPA